jgi:DNA-binding NtrC family response regulator
MQEGYPLRIFLVDEDVFSLAIYEQHFRNMKCSNFTSFNSIAQCVSRFDEKPQVIFLDYRTNPEKGLKIVSAVKKTIPDAYIIFITGPSGTLECLYSLQQGAFEYIIKDRTYPGQLESVLQRISKMEKIVYRKP